MNFNEIKAEIEKLEIKRTELESTLEKAKARREMYLQQIKTEFGIDETQIEQELKKLEAQKVEFEKNITAEFEKLKAYVDALQKALANAK